MGETEPIAQSHMVADLRGLPGLPTPLSLTFSLRWNRAPQTAEAFFPNVVSESSQLE